MKNTTENLKKKMLKHEQQFEKLWPKIVKDINDYVEANPDNSFYSFQNSNVEKFSEQLIFSGAWIQDRLNHKSGIVHAKEYKGSVTKGIRKALGYTL